MKEAPYTCIDDEGHSSETEGNYLETEGHLTRDERIM